MNQVEYAFNACDVIDIVESCLIEHVLALFALIIEKIAVQIVIKKRAQRDGGNQ